jgi:hypothetical protein
VRLSPFVVVWCCFCAASATAQVQTRGPVEGVWQFVEELVTEAGGSSTTMSGPGLLILTRNHYSFLRTLGVAQRSLFNAATPTTREKVAAYDSFAAATGTYEVSETALTVRPIVAKSPNYMAGGFENYQFRVAGDTLWLSNRCTDWHIRIGDRVGPNVACCEECVSRRRFVRVE